MSWSWTYDGGPEAGTDVVPPETFSSQSDAESWIGETWRELLSAGITSVTLVEDGQPSYTMSLEPAE